MTNKPHNRKRFIAGALCPKCHHMDTIALLYNAQHQEYITCVACGYHHDQADALPPKAPSAKTIKPVVWHKG